MADSEGIIKYHCHWQKGEPLPVEACAGLLAGRQQLAVQRYIGVDDQGIGYGNISQRWQSSSQFLITGSQTGSLPQLTPAHLSLVTDVDIGHNELHCQGPVKASSEAMSHGIIYQMRPACDCVIHIHDRRLWERYMSKWPTTPPEASYGSVALAQALKALLQVPSEPFQMIVMGGHEPGLLIYGQAIDKTIDYLLSMDKNG